MDNHTTTSGLYGEGTVDPPAVSSGLYGEGTVNHPAMTTSGLCGEEAAGQSAEDVSSAAVLDRDEGIESEEGMTFFLKLGKTGLCLLIPSYSFVVMVGSETRRPL